MKIILNHKEAAAMLKESLTREGIHADITIDDGDLPHEVKVSRFNDYWKNCIYPLDNSLTNRDGFKIQPGAHMRIPLIKLYRSMYKLATGQDCSLAQGKTFVETHQ